MIMPDIWRLVVPKTKYKTMSYLLNIAKIII